jgi:glycosyltransferase involved in cell wall biosynthesis
MAEQATLALAMRPTLTVITPSFNQASSLETTIRSVLDQGYENLEYFVVDGGSTDGSVEIIDRYSDRLAWWTSERDRGQTDALNKGLRRATGDIVAYINSDDWYLPGAFDHAVGALEQSGASWVVGAARFVDEHGEVTHVWRPELPRTRRRVWWMLDPWGVPQAATFWRRELFERHGHFREDMHYVFDTEYGLRLAFAGELPALIDEELAVRVVHPEAKSWDASKFVQEQRRFVDLYRPRMTPAERAELAVMRVALAAGVFRLTGAASRTYRRLRA